MTPSRSSSRRLAPVLLALALVLGACGGDDGGDADAAATTTTSSTTDAAADTEPDDALVEEDLDLDLPRTMTYANVEISIVAATMSNATPATFGRDEPTVGPDQVLYLDVTTAYVDGFPGADGRFPIDNFAVVDASGAAATASGVELSAELPVSSTNETAAVLAFEVDDGELDGASLVYDDGEHVPATLPLDGDVPEVVYPIRTEPEPGEVATASFRTGCDPAPADVELSALTWAVDGGVGSDGARLLAGRSSRALADHRILTVDLRVTARVGACGGTFANHEQVVVVVDGEHVRPINTYSTTLADGASEDLVYGFEVPVGAGSVELLVGAEGGTHAFEVPTPVPDEAP